MVTGVRGGAQRLHAECPGRYCSGERVPAQAGGWQGCAVFYERDSAFTALVYRFCAALRTCGIILSAILAMSGLCEGRLR